MVATAPHLLPLAPGTHACAFPASETETADLLAAFVGDGLARQERVFAALKPEVGEELLRRLSASGHDVGALKTRGALILLGPHEFYFTDGQLFPWPQARRLGLSEEAARAAGFTGFRAISQPPSAAQHRGALRRYEQELDATVRGLEATRLVCLFERHETPTGVLFEALHTHRVVLVDGHPRDNDYCELGSGAVAEDEARFARRLAEIARSGPGGRRAPSDGQARALELREALIALLARRLRAPFAELHICLDDLRFDLPRAAHDVLAAVETQIDRLERVVVRTEELSDFIHHPVEPRREPVDLVQLLRAVVRDWQSVPRQAAAAVRFEPEAKTLEMLGDPRRLAQVVNGALTVAFEHGWGTPIDLATEDRGDSARILVRFRTLEGATLGASPGGAGPDALRAVYDRLGLDLWVSRELVRLMGGTMGISVWPDDRVSLTLDLPRGP